MVYVEGFVAAVPVANKKLYEAHIAEAGPYFKKLGVTRFVECWEDDVPDGTLTDLRRAVKAEPDEAVVFSWLEYPSRGARDAANRAMTEDAANQSFEMPFDATRMIFAGFAGIFEDGPGGDMGYVDGTVIPVKTGDKDAYREISERYAAVFREHGATRLVDAWGDDVPPGKVTDYQRAVAAREGETVVYSWIEWPSKSVRDAAWPKIMQDPRMQGDQPFDGKRMIHGGFVPLLDL